MRKTGSTFDNICKYINSQPIGMIFTNALIRANCVIPGYKYRDLNRIICNYLIQLSSADVLSRPKRGHYKILARIPDFVTVATLEANSGYIKFVDGKPVARGTKWKADLSRIENIEKPKTMEEHVEKLAVQPALERLSSLLTIKKLFEDSYSGGVKIVYEIVGAHENIIALNVPVTAHNPKWFTTLESAINATSFLSNMNIDEVIERLLEANEPFTPLETRKSEIHDLMPEGPAADYGPTDHIPSGKHSHPFSDDSDSDDAFFDGRNDHLKNTDWYKNQVRLRKNLKDIKKHPKSIVIEDLIGKVIYYEYNNKLVKDIIDGFNIIFKKDEEPEINCITTEDGNEFSSLDDVFLSKRALTEHYQKMVDAL